MCACGQFTYILVCISTKVCNTLKINYVLLVFLDNNGSLFLIYLDPVLKEAAINAGGPSVATPTAPSGSSSGAATPMGGTGVAEQEEMKENAEQQNNGSQ